MSSYEMEDYIRARVSAYCSLSGITRKQIAEQLEMPYSTFTSKLHGPSEFSYREGLQLAKILGITPDELISPISTNSATS